MTEVRVIRILEYTYKNEQAYLNDRARWTHGHTAGHMAMKSAILPVDLLQEFDTDLDTMNVTHGCDDCLPIHETETIERHGLEGD